MLAAATASTPGLAQTAAGTADAPANSSMNGELFYQLLLGEVNASGGEPGVGYQLILDAARKTNEPRLFKRAVDIALQARSGESALQAARAWRQAFPAAREANRYLLQILIGLNRFVDLPEPLKRELATADGNDLVQALNNIPRLFARAGDKKQAVQVVEQALSEYLTTPTYGPAAWTTIGRMRIDAADAAGALDAAQRGHALDNAAEGPAVLALALLDPKVPAAEALLQKHLQGNARAEIRMDYARALLNNQRYAESATQIKLVTDARPTYAQAWLVRGILEQQDRQLAAAESSLKRFVALETSQPTASDSDEPNRGLTQAYLALAEIASQKKEFAESQSWLARIDSPQDMMTVQSRRASLLARQGQIAEARALIRGLPESNPADGRMKISAEVQILRDNKQYRAAYDFLVDATKRFADDVDLVYDQAMVAEKADLLPEMERLLRQVISRKPDYHHAYNALGYSLADRNLRLPEARQLIVKALEFAPDDPYITDSLAWVEFRSGNLPEALRLLQKAFKDKPDAEIAAHLGEVLWAMGDRAQAVLVWRQGMALNAENETLLETIKRLRVSL